MVTLLQLAVTDENMNITWRQLPQSQIMITSVTKQPCGSRPRYGMNRSGHGSGRLIDSDNSSFTATPASPSPTWQTDAITALQDDALSSRRSTFWPPTPTVSSPPYVQLSVAFTLTHWFISDTKLPTCIPFEPLSPPRSPETEICSLHA